MQLPSIAKQLGNVTGENKVYIEDYVYTYLNHLKEERNPLPSRVALYGRASKNEDKNLYFIYGAAHVIEELEQRKNEEDIRQTFFSEYQLIGYVNIYNEKKALPGKKEGYYVFYESNEAMQNYLLYCYKRKEKQKEQDANVLDSKWKKLKPTIVHKRHKYNFFQNMLLMFCVGVTAITVITINNFSQMEAFAQAAELAIEMIAEQ